ncbi:MAG: hypothetical protein OXI66_07025 [Boseongicola sp.]|nr:hypothetical protein [Boseongicola sp.]
MMNRVATGVLAFAATGALTACSGSGPESFDGIAAISLTGSVGPAETVADQAARSAEIVSRANAIVATALHVEEDGEEIRIDPDCDGTQCRFMIPSTGTALGTFTLADLLDLQTGEGTHRAVLTRHGITLVESRDGIGRPGFRAYGAWTEHGAFSVQTGVRSASDDPPPVALRGALAGGEIVGSQPPASATWLGVMVGTPARGESRDNILQGDATLTYDLESRTLGAEFTSIVDLDLEAPHTVTEVSFAHVPVAGDGTYRRGGDGDFIWGGFDGPGHEETSGVFEREGIVGAFGAKRQAPG